MTQDVTHHVRSHARRRPRHRRGRLDLLVNDIWGGDPLTNWQQPFWQHSLADGLRIQELAVKTHMITSYYGAPVMLKQGRIRPDG